MEMKNNEMTRDTIMNFTTKNCNMEVGKQPEN